LKYQGFFSQDESIQGVKPTHLHLASKLSISKALALLPFYVFITCTGIYLFYLLRTESGAGTAQSVQWLATGWTIRESNHGECDASTAPCIQRVPYHLLKIRFNNISKSSVRFYTFTISKRITHPTPSSADVKERIELYLYSPSGPS
jgi:hypothetical protein